MPNHIYDLSPSRPDSRDTAYAAVLPRGVALPPAADLGDCAPPIKDQGQEGSCTGFSLSSAREALWLKGGSPYIALSPAFIYYEERRIEHDDDQDAGANLRDGCKVLQKLGVCPEDAMPYVAGQFTTPPGPGAQGAAGGYKIAAYHRILSLKSAQGVLVSGHPVVLGIAVYASFERVGHNGKVPMPKPDEEMLGGHAILCVGYRADKAVAGGGELILHNSWGVGEGDKGRFYLPYAYATDKDLTFEKWGIS